MIIWKVLSEGEDLEGPQIVIFLVTLSIHLFSCSYMFPLPGSQSLYLKYASNWASEKVSYSLLCIWTLVCKFSTTVWSWLANGRFPYFEKIHCILLGCLLHLTLVSSGGKNVVIWQKKKKTKHTMLFKEKKNNYVQCEYLLFDLKVKQSNLPQIFVKIILIASATQKD